MQCFLVRGAVVDEQHFEVWISRGVQDRGHAFLQQLWPVTRRDDDADTWGLQRCSQAHPIEVCFECHRALDASSLQVCLDRQVGVCSGLGVHGAAFASVVEDEGNVHDLLGGQYLGAT